MITMYVPNKYTYNYKLNYFVLDKDGNQEHYEKYVTREQAENRMADLKEYPHITDINIEEICVK